MTDTVAVKTEDERERFEAWFVAIQQPAMNAVGIKRAEQKMVKSASFMAWQARAMEGE